MNAENRIAACFFVFGSGQHYTAAAIPPGFCLVDINPASPLPNGTRRFGYESFRIAACAAASRAMGTRNGLHDT